MARLGLARLGEVRWGGAGEGPARFAYPENQQHPVSPLSADVWRRTATLAYRSHPGFHSAALAVV